MSLQRFEGQAGRQALVEALLRQKIVGGNVTLANELVDCIKLRVVEKRAYLIQQGAHDTDLFLILDGTVDLMVNSQMVGRRMTNEHVGEITAIEPTHKRAASAVAIGAPAVVAVLSSADLAKFGDRYTEIYRCIARDLAQQMILSDIML